MNKVVQRFVTAANGQYYLETTSTPFTKFEDKSALKRQKFIFCK